LECLVALSPLLHVNLKMPFSRTVVVFDASSHGAGVCYQSFPRRVVESVAERKIRGNAYTTLDSCSLEMEPCLNKFVHGPWRVALATRWQHMDHINILEGHACLLSLKWLSKFPESQDTRFLFLSDSQVIVGAFQKGRSSSRRILNLCRRFAAYLLVLNIRPYFVWIPTDVNPADVPSRKFSPSH
jgi:hypothetical protein